MSRIAIMFRIDLRRGVVQWVGELHGRGVTRRASMLCGLDAVEADTAAQTPYAFIRQRGGLHPMVTVNLSALASSR
jgi:hypothetical protein